jgi:very-short-patch-repair endonuclease
VVFVVAMNLFAGVGDEDKKKYQYKRKNFFLTRAEHECFDALMTAVGNDYLIFAQVHLPTLLDNKVVGQNWRGAFRHINGKSVDFVLCDKAYIAPKLAIELDDKTHERPDRQERDVEVERILKEAGIPLLRLENRGSFSASDLAQKVTDVLKGKAS